MVNSREAKLTLDISRVSGGPHDLVCAIGRDSLPDEMFDPTGENRGFGGEARFYDLNGQELARDYVAGSFVPDKSPGAGDGYVEYWVRLPQISGAIQNFFITVQYGNPELQDYPVEAEFGRNATWVDAELAIVGSTNTDRTGNSNWGFVGFPAVVRGGPFGSFRSFESNDRYLSSSPNIGARLRTSDWCLTSVSLRERYGFSPAIAHFSGTQDVKLYPLDSNAGSGARLTWGSQISGTQLAISKTGQARLWQWVDVSVTSSSQRLRLNGAQAGDTENIFIADPGDFSGGQSAIGGAADFSEDFSGYVAALILWKSSKQDDWILSNYELAQPNAWSVGNPGPVGGEPVVYEETLSLNFAVQTALQHRLRLDETVALSLSSGLGLEEILAVRADVAVATGFGLEFIGSLKVDGLINLDMSLDISPNPKFKIIECLMEGLQLGFEAGNVLRWHEAVSFGVSAALGPDGKRLISAGVDVGFVSEVALDSRTLFDTELNIALQHSLGVQFSHDSHLTGVSPPGVSGIGPRHFTFLEYPATGVFESAERVNDDEVAARDLRPLADLNDNFLQHRLRLLVPEFDLRKTRSGE